MTRNNAVKYLEKQGFIITPIVIQCELAGGHVTVGYRAVRESDGLRIKSKTKCGLVRIYKMYAITISAIMPNNQTNAKRI